MGIVGKQLFFAAIRGLRNKSDFFTHLCRWPQAEILGRPHRLVSELIAGKRAITPETATGLGEAFNTGAQFWMNLESSYRLAQVKPDGSNSVSRRAKLYEKAPVKEMMRRYWIQPTENIDVLEKSVLDFLHIKSLAEQPQLSPHEAPNSTSYAEHSPAEQAWLFRARQLAQAVDVKPFSETGLASALARFKNMLRDPEDASGAARPGRCGCSVSGGRNFAANPN